MEATEITTFTSARGIDGGMVHEDETFNVDPHGYALAFVTRMGMAGNVEVSARLRLKGDTPYTKGDEYLDWHYTGVWKSIDDEPYRVSLVADFSEKVDA